MPATAAAPAADLARLTRLFRALGDETRLLLIDQLRGGERCVCDLMDALGAQQSRLSFHLKVLKDAGLVSDRKEGRWSYYQLNPEAFAAMQDVVGELPSTPLPLLAQCCPVPGGTPLGGLPLGHASGCCG